MDSGPGARSGTATAPPMGRQDNYGGPRQWDNRAGDRGGFNMGNMHMGYVGAFVEI